MEDPAASFADSQATDVEATPTLKSKSRLADYAIEKKIGKGQFSVVYKAVRLSDNLPVALKKIPVIKHFNYIIWWWIRLVKWWMKRQRTIVSRKSICSKYVFFFIWIRLENSLLIISMSFGIMTVLSRITNWILCWTWLMLAICRKWLNISRVRRSTFPRGQFGMLVLSLLTYPLIW